MSNIIIPIITGIVCLAVGVIIGFLYRKSVAEKEIGSAETEATRIINEAIKAGETKKRESILEAKDEIHKQRVEADRELKERRNETQQLERRLIQREEALDKKKLPLQIADRLRLIFLFLALFVQSATAALSYSVAVKYYILRILGIIFKMKLSGHRICFPGPQFIMGTAICILHRRKHHAVRILNDHIFFLRFLL